MFKTFDKNVGKLTRDQEILEIVTGYTIQMLSQPLRRSAPVRKGILQIESVMTEKEAKICLAFSFKHKSNYIPRQYFSVEKTMEEAL